MPPLPHLRREVLLPLLPLPFLPVKTLLFPLRPLLLSKMPRWRAARAAACLLPLPLPLRRPSPCSRAVAMRVLCCPMHRVGRCVVQRMPCLWTAELLRRGRPGPSARWAGDLALPAGTWCLFQVRFGMCSVDEKQG